MCNSRIFYIASLVLVALGLAACGGGGTPASESRAIGLNFQGNLATKVQPTAYAAQSDERQMFDELNDARLQGGFGMLSQNTALDLAAQRHVDYIFTNFYTPNSIGSYQFDAAYLLSGVTTAGIAGFHVEEAGRPGFSGQLPAQRAKSAGYNDAYFVGEVGIAARIASGDERRQCVDLWLTTVFHRSALLNTQLRDVGIAMRKVALTSPNSSADSDMVCIMNPAFTLTNVGVAPTGWVGVYPYADQTGLATSFAAETPDPLPTLLVKGNPVSISVEPQNTLTVTSFELASGNGAAVTVKLLTAADFPQYLSPNTAFIVPTAPLEARTTYTASFVGINAGTPLSKRWRFTTR